MKGYQVYNLVWLIIWALLGIGGIYGIIMGNWVHLITAGGSGYFSYLFIVDKEYGESLKEFAVRMVKPLTDKK